MKSVSSYLSAVVAGGLLIFTGVSQSSELPPEYAFVQDIFPNIEINDVRPSVMPGLLEMVVGGDIFYITDDGRYFFQGDLVDIKSRRNLTEQAKEGARLAYVNRFGDEESILFAADDPIAEVLVFTDIDCGYCRKLHREMDGYLENGISIRYLFFPRSGPGTESWRKAQDVWCAESRQDALTKAKNNQDFATNKPCDASIVAKHYALVKELGLNGTPALLTAEGRLIVGYRSPEELLDILNESS